ncbi:MAG TPA: tRNA (N6-threonylcarbamoyladenosine(37)-N6)-methyltransferase TrmO [Chloroflexi bacterium]|nr:tRNA (N6-threonylcarbamoyladenosine(37)-N6)-methyltransferase TrmO [Chloroflexota bacterium]
MAGPFVFRPIGVIRSPFTEREGMPIQSARSEAEGRVEVFEAYAEGLKDIEGFSHLILIYVFDRIEHPALTVRPFLDDAPHGIFATRHPARPNPIGLSVVELVSREGATLHIRGVDVLDGTPLLDIKPYVPQFDHHTATRTGWLKGQEEERPWEARYE